MKALVTGAAGFLGRAVVRHLLERGHEVVAMVRPASSPSRLDKAELLTILYGDLRQDGAWRDRLGGVDTIIHLAAATSGDLPEQFAGSVVATEKLLQAIDPRQIRRFVHVSSFSVYDFAGLASGATLDEQSPLEQQPEQRDAYTWAKLVQEQLVSEFCREADLSLAVLRPGAIYGPGKTWDYGSALSLGKIDLVFAPFARMRLTQVDNCADAIVVAAETDVEGTFNVVDDVLPSHWRYRRLGRRAGADVAASLPVPWFAVAAAGLLLRFINRRLLGGRARLPEFLAYRRQLARWKPLQYSNLKLKAETGWTPRVSIAQGVAQMVAADRARRRPHEFDLNERSGAIPQATGASQ